MNRGLVLLLLICLIAGGVRLYRLGETDARSDEVELLIPPISEFGPLENAVRDFQAFKSGRILILPRMTGSAFLRLFDLEVNRRNVRLPYALAGILTIPALYLLGRNLQGRRLALILSFLGAVNPYLILFSRQAHVYAFPLLFNVLVAAFAAGVTGALRNRRPPSAAVSAGLCVSSILASHSHMSSWPFVGLVWLLIAGLLVTHRREDCFRPAARRMGWGLGIWLLCLLPWIVIFVSALFTAQDTFIEGAGLDAFLAMWRLPFAMTWGGGPWYRALLSLGLLGAGIGLGWKAESWRRTVQVLLGAGLILFAVMSVMMIGSGFFQMRYYTPLWLIFNLLSGLGILLLSERLARLPAFRRAGPAAGAGIMTAICLVVAITALKPLHAIAHMPGNPVPYTRVTQWMDRNLPKGTLVIVDRWFEPWNEMLYHAPTNVEVTFTIPNEPLNVFLRHRWRKTVRDFVGKYPDAAYFEMAKQYFHEPTVGPWEWPRRHFRQRVAFTNEEVLFLRNAVLAPDGCYAANTNRIVTELFYSTREDLVEQARGAGRPMLWLYGEGWGYTKLWRQQPGDFRDWRILERKAELDVFNLTDADLDVQLEVVGVALPEAKRVQVQGGGGADFPGQRIETRTFGPFTLAPGTNSLVFHDPLWGQRQAALLVGDIQVRPVSTSVRTRSGPTSM